MPGWPANTSHAMLVRAPDATHVYTGMDLARLTGALKAVGRGDRGRSRQNRHPRSRVLRRRSVLPGRQDAALYGPAGRAADLREVRRVRSGAAGAARRDVRQVRRGDRPGRHCPITARSASPAWRAPRRTRPSLFADPGGLGQPWPHPEHGAAGLVAVRQGNAWRPTPRPRPMASRSAPSSMPNNPALLVLDREFETQSVDPMFLEPESGLAWYDRQGRQARTRARRAVALRGGGVGRVSARQGPRAVQAGADQRPVRLCRRRLRRARPHAVPALCRARGDVLSRPAGAAGA